MRYLFSGRHAGKRWSCRLLGLAFLFQLSARADQVVYDDARENGWQDWGWTVLNYTNTSPVYSGSDSISVTISEAWAGIQLYHPGMDASPYSGISVWLNGGDSGGQKLQMYGLVDLDGTNNWAQSARYSLGTLAPNAWQQFIVPLSALGVAGSNNFTGFVIQDSQGTAEPTFYVDDISLVANSTTSGTNAPVSITVNAMGNRHAISPMIYGVAFASSNQLADLNFTMNRSGGNNETRDNWQMNAHNLDADWYFESYPDSTNTVPGATADAFVANSKNGGARPMITLSMIGWMPKLGTGRSILYSYSTGKYGPQTSTDPYLPAAGNGHGTNTAAHTGWLITTNGPVNPANGAIVTSGLNGFTATNDPNDANFLTNSTFEQGLVQHLMSKWGASTNGGVAYYFIDNEHSIWFGTHQDVHPVGPTMQEIWTDMVTYASMVKTTDPNALVCGPEEWGWNGYLYSGYDQQWAAQHGYVSPNTYPDRTANGGWDYMPWLLNHFQQYDTANQQRLLDYFTLHCYPQEANVGGNAVDPATELLRNQSTRQFWDTNYVDPSWINSVIALIPRMKSWVATNYPGTKIGITEYNWGAEPYINGATAQADILGIFGWQGLDLATRWTTPDPGTPTFKAMKLYRNYDGNKSTFGDTSILTTVPNPDNLSAFGAVRTRDAAMTLMVINKDLNNATPIMANLTNFNAAGTVQRWQLTSANAINHLADIVLTNGILSDLLPARSITLFVLPATNTFNLQIGDNDAPGQLGIRLNGEAGQSYMLESSPDLFHWSATNTNLLASNSIEFVVPTTNATRMFYRGRLSSP